MNEHQQLTKYIKHLADSANFKAVTFNDNFSSFIETLNKLTSLDKSLVPMSLNITYEN